MPDLLETAENGITTLTLNRPERLNALSPAMTAGLKETLERLSTDKDCGAIVITGAGRGWCAGGDVKTMESRGADQTFEDRVEGLRHAHQLLGGGIVTEVFLDAAQVHAVERGSGTLAGA